MAPYCLHPTLTALNQGSPKNPAQGACQAPDVSSDAATAGQDQSQSGAGCYCWWNQANDFNSPIRGEAWTMAGQISGLIWFNGINRVVNLENSWLGTSITLGASKLKLPWAKEEEGWGDCTPLFNLLLPSSLQSSQPMDTETLKWEREG